MKRFEDLERNKRYQYDEIEDHEININDKAFNNFIIVKKYQLRGMQNLEGKSRK
jgi:hypothetical protein